MAALVAVVLPQPLVLSATGPAPSVALDTWYRTGDADLDRLQEWLRPTLDANARQFLGRTGLVQGFGAGSSYPQIWLRDSATLVSLAADHLSLIHI